MALSKPKSIFGIHQVTPYEIASGLPYGTLRVLGGSTLSLSGELINLLGGSSKYPWEAQDGAITAEMSLKVKELPNFLLKLFLGKTPTEVLADPGNVTALANIKGTSVLDATTGIASVGVKTGSEDDLKFSKYIVKAVSPTTVDVYALTNSDFQRGVDKTYEDDLLKITETPLTITLAVPVDVPDFGVELTGGSGAIAMIADDTAKFSARPPSIEQSTVKIGGINDCIPEFGAVVSAQKKADGSMWTFDCFRLRALGFPFGMEEKAYNEAEITATLMYDSVEDGIFNMEYVEPTIACS